MYVYMCIYTHILVLFMVPGFPDSGFLFSSAFIHPRSKLRKPPCFGQGLSFLYGSRISRLWFLIF